MGRSRCSRQVGFKLALKAGIRISFFFKLKLFYYFFFNSLSSIFFLFFSFSFFQTFNFLHWADIREQKEHKNGNPWTSRVNLGMSWNELMVQHKHLRGWAGLGPRPKGRALVLGCTAWRAAVCTCMVPKGLQVSPPDWFENWDGITLGSLAVGVRREKRLESGRRAKNAVLNYFSIP